METGNISTKIYVILILKIYTLALVSGLFISCSSTPDSFDPNSIFYPPLPDEPRIQFLVSYAGNNRQGIEKNSFADFVLGDKTTQDDVTPLRKPYGVAIYNNLLYVIDTRLPGYVVLSPEDKIISSIRGRGAGRFIKPINITIDTDGTKYITDTVRHKVLVYDKNDNYLRSIGNSNTMRPSDVLIMNDRLYISDLKNHNIHVVDKYTGGQYFTIGKTGSAQNALFYPTNLAKTPEGQFYISDTGNFSIKKYTRSGTFIKQMGSAGRVAGSFARPKGIAVDRSGLIYVVDAAFQNVQVFNNNGQVLVAFGGSGYNPGNLNLPVDITIDYEHSFLFQKYAKPGFKIEYIILVTSQYGPFKVNVYGFGTLDLEKYSKDFDATLPEPSTSEVLSN